MNDSQTLIVRKTLGLLNSMVNSGEQHSETSKNMLDEARISIDKIEERLNFETTKSGRNDLLVSEKFAEENEKLIKWFMELAIIMEEDGYTLESLLSIDVSSWVEMFQHGETPQTAYLEDMSNG